MTIGYLPGSRIVTSNTAPPPAGTSQVSQGELDDIRTTLAPGTAIERIYRVNLTDRDGTVHVEVETSIHIRRREAAPPC